MILNMLNDKTPRSWHVNTLELRLAVAVSVICIVILMLFLLWNPKKHHPTQVAHTQAVTTTTPKPKKEVAHISKPPKTKPIKVAQKKIVKQPIKKLKPLIKEPNGYIVQLGAFKSQQRANVLRNTLSHKKWNASILQKKNHLYAVYIGPYKNKATALSMKSRLSKNEKINGFITHLP
jgi:cell division septation protein DedD